MQCDSALEQRSLAPRRARCQRRRHRRDGELNVAAICGAHAAPVAALSSADATAVAAATAARRSTLQRRPPSLRRTPASLSGASPSRRGRLPAQAASAVEYTRQMMDSMGMDVTLQPCEVPHWVRGDKEQARVVNSTSMGTVDLTVLALGNSVGTSDYGVTAPVIEVHSLDEVKELGAKGQIAGKIIFYNRPMDPTQIKTFHAYGGAVDQRGHGAAIAANFGAVGVIVRSMTLRTDDIPHTGALSYQFLKEGIKPIAGLAVSTQDADLLSSIIKNDEEVSLYMKTNC